MRRLLGYILGSIGKCGRIPVESNVPIVCVKYGTICNNHGITNTRRWQFNECRDVQKMAFSSNRTIIKSNESSEFPNDGIIDDFSETEPQTGRNVRKPYKKSKSSDLDLNDYSSKFKNRRERANFGNDLKRNKIGSDSSYKPGKESFHGEGFNEDERSIPEDFALSSRLNDIGPDDGVSPEERMEESVAENFTKNKEQGDGQDIVCHELYFEKELNDYFLKIYKCAPYLNSIKGNVDAAPLGRHTFYLREKLIIPSFKGRTSTGKHLVAKIFLTGYMDDHLDTVAYFIRYCAQYAEIPCSPVITMPIKIKRWKIHKSPFVKVKNKEGFECRLHTRVLQLYDADTISVDSVIDFAKLRLPRGINMKIVSYDYDTMENVKQHHNELITNYPDIEQYIKLRKEPFELKVEERAATILKSWNSASK